MRIIISILLIFFASNTLAEDFEFEGDIHFNKPYLFVSLGCNCWQAQALRNRLELIDILDDQSCASTIKSHGLRDAAFPFDWLFTLDNKKIIQCLDENFQYFNDESYFVRYDGIHLENTRYNFKFTHDWPYHGHEVNPERHAGQLQFILFERFQQKLITKMKALKIYMMH